MFMTLLKGMLILFMLAGIVGIAYGVWEIWRTVTFVAQTTDTVKGTFVGYHREVHRTTSIRSYSPANPKMPSTTQSYSVATYPEFAYCSDSGHESVVRESKVHVFSIYKPGEEVDVLLSPTGSPRMAGFYSLYFRDVLIFGLGLAALVLALVFWNFAVPLISKPHPVTVYSDGSATVADSVRSPQSSETVEEVFDGILKEALDFRVGPVKMKHILFGFGGLFLLVIILSFFFGSNRP